jgi:hypothetical protein
MHRELGVLVIFHATFIILPASSTRQQCFAIYPHAVSILHFPFTGKRFKFKSCPVKCQKFKVVILPIFLHSEAILGSLVWTTVIITNIFLDK